MIWDTFHAKVPMERACLGHVGLLPRSLHYIVIKFKIGKVSKNVKCPRFDVYS